MTKKTKKTKKTNEEGVKPTMPTVESESLLTIHEAAVIARTTVEGLRTRWRRKALPVVRFGDRRVLIRHTDLMALLRSDSIR